MREAAEEQKRRARLCLMLSKLYGDVGYVPVRVRERRDEPKVVSAVQHGKEHM